jgi:hypothetical protein
MADQTTLFGFPGETPSADLSLALTATEKEWLFNGEVSGNATRQVGVIGFICDVAWHYSSRSGGPYLPIPAGVFVNFPVKSGKSYYVKAVTGTGTLSVVVTG